jgi:hypothetical protein
MAARKCIGRARVIPSGYDFKDVLNKGKAFHKNTDFEMQPHNFSGVTLWSAETVTREPFKAPEGTIIVIRIKQGWKIQD